MKDKGYKSTSIGPMLGRRGLLGVTCGLLPALAYGTTVAATTPSELDRLEALVKMRGSTDGRMGFSWISGVRYAQVGQEIRPICGFLNCTIARYRRISPEAFDLRLYELSFYTHLQTGRYRPTLVMPFTGKVVDVPLYRTGPGQHIVKTSNHEEMTWSKQNTTSEKAANQLAPDGKIIYSVELSKPTIVGNDLWLSTEATTRLVPANPSEKAWFYKELITNHGSLNALTDKGVTSVDSATSYTLVAGWRPWMKMDGLDGQTIDHAVGGRVWNLADLPQDILFHIREYHPDVAKEPTKWLPA